MNTRNDPAHQTSQAELLTVLKIAVCAAKQTLVWVGLFFAFLGGAAAISIGVTLISTTPLAVAISIILVLGLTASPPNRLRNDFEPPQ